MFGFIAPSGVTILNIVLSLAAGVLFLGVMGEKDNQRHRSITIAFVAVIALIICANTIF